MKTGKITAKLRDAVPVCLMVDGNEVMRYKNIELPDAIKEIEMKDFHFYIPTDGKITFQIHYENGVLPATFPALRAKMTRAEKAAAKAAEETTADTEEATESEDGGMEIHYNVNGPRRKELAAAVGDFIGAAPQFMRAPTYAFAVGSYTIGRDGTLTGEANSELVETLAAKGFIAA